MQKYLKFSIMYLAGSLVFGGNALAWIERGGSGSLVLFLISAITSIFCAFLAFRSFVRYNKH